MKLILIFIIFIFCQAVPVNEANAVQTTRVLIIHKESRPFIIKPARRYLKHRIIQKRVEHRRIMNAPRKK